MTLLTLLSCNAVPFSYPDDDKSIAARRYRSKRLAREFSTRAAQQQVEQHLFMSTVVDEAVDAFRSVLVNDPSQELPLNKMVQITRAPPNSPNNTLTFDFPEPSTDNLLNEDDGLDIPTMFYPIEMSPVSSSSNNVQQTQEKTLINRQSRGRRSLRKRRRVPSFKTKQEPRVPNKVSNVEASEADDEASDDDSSIVCRHLAMITKATGRLATGHLGRRHFTEHETSSEDDVSSELHLKLQVLSEVQKTVSGYDEERMRQTDWAKVGVELRQIADRFSSNSDGSSSEEDVVDGRANREVDFVSVVNMMLPFSVPQSLWSALVSYAAWKIFKRFQ